MPRIKTLGVERLALVALALLLIGAGIGWRQPMNVDEERFLGVALEMLQNGNWFIPHRAAEIYGDKPPLFMWTVALFTALTGLPKVALYLPGLLSAATITLVLHDLGRRLWNRRIGRIAALLFLATYQTYSILRTGQIDSFLCLWVALGLYGMVRHLLLGPAWGWFYLACAAMGLGIISKGVGFVPALMLLPYAWAVRRGWRGVVAMPGQGWRWSLGLVWLLLGCAVWLLPLLVSIAQGGGAAELAYLKEILLRQTANRYANAWDHREPFWYFFVEVIPKYWLPLILALPWLVPAWRKQLQKRDGRILLLLGWVALVLLFFSLSSGKRKLYIFPALPGLVLAIAPLVPWLLKRWFQQRPVWRKVFVTVAVVWFCLWFARGFVEPAKEGRNPHETLMADAARPPVAPSWCWSTGARGIGCSLASRSFISASLAAPPQIRRSTGYVATPEPMRYFQPTKWGAASAPIRPAGWAIPLGPSGFWSMPMPTMASVTLLPPHRSFHSAGPARPKRALNVSA